MLAPDCLLLSDGARWIVARQSLGGSWFSFDTAEAFTLDDCRGRDRDHFKSHYTEFE